MDLLSKLLPLRVKVHSGDGKTNLGEGTYVADVTVYGIRAGMHLYSHHNAEEPFTDAEIKAIAEISDNEPEQDSIENNPKIVLDSGKTVYGCQVWWEPIDSLEEIARKIADIETREGSQH